MLIVLHGLPGVGKSTLAGKIQEMTDGMVLGSNYIRRHIFGCDSYTCANVSLMPFTDQEIILSYRTILYCAELVLSCGKTVIMDATFQKKMYIEMAKETARKTGHKFVLIKVICDEAICKQRMDERVKNKTSDSIVGYDHHLKVKEEIFEEYPQAEFTYDSSQHDKLQLEELRLLLLPELPQSHNSAI
ncbi:hypothetical protein A3J20_05700 [Candidatus Gottesmanbacteria bacterium RIFCSPLOWO2_02_FULL_42_29]|uniref:Kinase n=2 Tax=Candidatus Gottesmaniibacteriota TaxID=1752720 RepID=A0A1F6BJH8_9BACT|nr:MAG: hypothetical protein A2781_01135 [Candidatus Gottesmanbacteria bacterium RIFCSPHIGHO2_01_FULL_42_27]OGG22239.1 MAG: hypothetical protein A3E72_02950 [Candidatus Gottesmanbacteria bacterium RIFCSPHIGHO2_12_FULL_43_26]OGG33220.1 MAG: hypothetical protein A3G68_07265 [Candidatus Gottesmanbacteria bacterium RIFCSPLOWO2_12_FULL_42_10]OGG37060.1 MAG: hypothetical protein A2968_01265 [Candidatus Gottesmanbacteria bacterium RIFCSPLOWO2_01_FULL_42_22]OGG38921.1 MAG: hypothetical protein A3J20_05